MIKYRTDKDISASAVQIMFRQNQWHDWFSVKDTEWYLEHTLFIASAWHGKQVVGLAVLTGDGKSDIEFESLIVDKKHRRKGIGKALIKLAVKKAKELKPYHFKIEVFEKRTERLYARFGFKRNKGTWLLEHPGIGNKLLKRVRKIRGKKE
jgi:GNAT superfamily N-acetyltransferase